MVKSKPKAMNDGSTMIVTYGLQSFSGQLPYFSITAEISKDGRVESCGCLHSEIRETFPELAELIPFHLASTDGRPMHYVANAIYWAELTMGISKWQGETAIPRGHNSFEDVLASHALADVLGDREELTDAIMLSKPDFKAWLESRGPRLLEAMISTLASHGISIS